METNANGESHWVDTTAISASSFDEEEAPFELTIRRVVRTGDSLVEEAHAPSGEDEEWYRDLFRSTRRLLQSEKSIAFSIVAHDPSSTNEERTIVSINRRETDGFRAFFFPAATADGTAPALPAAGEITPKLTELGILSHPEPGIVIMLTGIFDHEIRLSRRDRELLTRIALHIETSYRLRGQPEIAKAILDADGKVLSVRDDADGAELGGADLWQALASGRLSLSEHGWGKHRQYRVVENAATSQPFRELTKTEIDVVTHSVDGLSTKMIGYALGLSSPTVSTRLGIAAAKVGAATRMDVVRLAAAFTRTAATTTKEIALTAAERDVLQLIQRGLTNDQIASARSRSVRTIANQVASLLKKTQSNSRRALAAAT